MRAMDGERFLILPKTFFFTTQPHSEISTVVGKGEKTSFREYQESLTVHRAYGVEHRNERLQLSESFPEPPERRFQRFELPGSLSGACRGPPISDNPRVTKTQTKAVGSTGSTY